MRKISAKQRRVIEARIACELVELPKILSEQLWGLMGQKVRTARLDGKFRVGAQT